jgi:mannose-6-phosphate isomerase-like protein (cupin superfamily)
MNIFHSEAAPPYAVGDNSITGYAAPSRGATQVSLWRIELAPGASSPLHEMDVEEVFLGISGEAAVVVGGTESTIGPGDCLILPAGTPFTLTAGTEHSFQAVACMTAGGKATMLPGGETFLPPWAE